MFSDALKGDGVIVSCAETNLKAAFKDVRGALRMRGDITTV